MSLQLDYLTFIYITIHYSNLLYGTSQ